MGQWSPVHDPLRPSSTPCGPTARSRSPERPTALQNPRLHPAAGPRPGRGQGIERVQRGPRGAECDRTQGSASQGTRGEPCGTRRLSGEALVGWHGHVGAPTPRVSVLLPFAFSVSRTSGPKGPRRLSLGWRSAQLLNDGAHSRARPRTRRVAVRRGPASGVFSARRPL